MIEKKKQVCPKYIRVVLFKVKGEFIKRFIISIAFLFLKFYFSNLYKYDKYSTKINVSSNNLKIYIFLYHMAFRKRRS